MSDPILLTPGPLTTSRSTKEAMLRDWGSWDSSFKAVTARILDRLTKLAEGTHAYACVPMQGSGTFAVEAMIGTLLPRDGKVLVPVNGAYCRRIVEICRYLGRTAVPLELLEDQRLAPDVLAERLAHDPTITHVALVQCETTSGIDNGIHELAKVITKAGRRLLLDAISAFGALPLDLRTVSADGVAISANKCIEGVPGAGFVLCKRDVLAAAMGTAHSLSLDLHAQWMHMEKTGQWRYTPPTHVIAAFDQALSLHEQEGGTEARGARYRQNCNILVTGMRARGFQTLLPDALQSPIIVTFLCPGDARFTFSKFYDLLKSRGFIIYPGKITAADTFRIGCIGQVHAEDMRRLLTVIDDCLRDMGVTNCAPALAA